MYGWIWRQIPGPFVVRLLLLLGLLAGLVIICFQLVYPRISAYMPFNQQTVEDTSSGGETGSSPTGDTTDQTSPADLPTETPAP